MLCIPHQIFGGWSNQEQDGRSIWHLGGTEEVYTGFWWRDPEENEPLGRPRHRWVYNFKTDLKEVGLEGMEEIALAQHRDWKEHLWMRYELSGYIKCEQIL